MILLSPAYKQKHHNNNQGNDWNAYPHRFHEYLLLEIPANSKNYSTEDKEKINYYLSHPDQRKKIALAGRERAYKEHRYEDRLKLIIDTIAFRTKGYEMPNIVLNT